MTVFISWSGERSKAVALIFKRHLGHVIQGLPTFMSDKDIASGTQWFSEISKHLSKATFGIICVTPTNIDRPWLNFEAGAIGNQTEQSRVAPVAIDMLKDNLPSPLNGFNAVDLNEDGFVRLVESIFETRDDVAPWEIIEAAAHRQWGDIEAELAALPSAPVTEAPEFSVEDTLKEMRGLLRDLARSPQRWMQPDVLQAMEVKAVRDAHMVKPTDRADLHFVFSSKTRKKTMSDIRRLLVDYHAGSAQAGEDLVAIGIDPNNEWALSEIIREQQRLLDMEDPDSGDSSSGPADPA